MDRGLCRSGRGGTKPQIFYARSRSIATAVTFTLMAGLRLVAPLSAQSKDQSRARGREEFFIVSSVDTGKKQLLLKRPTEVTEVVRVNDKTVFLDEQGRQINFSDLHAGDTIFLVSIRSTAGGPRFALRIREGPMTLEELRRRYLNR